jgi:phenylalanyl-tRNA synthetase beta chain
VESLLTSLHVAESLEVSTTTLPLLESERQCRLTLNGRLLGYLGAVSDDGLKEFGLRSATTVAELDVGVLAAAANLVPQQQDLSDYPSIVRDLNLIVSETARWSELETSIRQAAGPLLESLAFQEVYRDKKKDGPDKKRLLFSITLRSPERTLTNEEADQVRQDVVDACHQHHGAVLLG